MPTLNNAGTINQSPRLLAGPEGSSSLLQIESTYAHLSAMLGETGTHEEAAPSWVVLVQSGDERGNERVEIHHSSNWPREDVNELTLWHINAHRDGRWAAERLGAALGEIVEPDYSHAV